MEKYPIKVAQAIKSEDTALYNLMWYKSILEIRLLTFVTVLYAKRCIYPTEKYKFTKKNNSRPGINNSRPVIKLH